MGSASMLASVAMRRLQGKVALITGGAGCIGECTARLFSQHGASVCGCIGGVASHTYTSSKNVVGLMRNTAVELGRVGIRVNCVSPYVVATPLAKDFFRLDNEGVHGVYSNLEGAILEPQDEGEAAPYLASDQSRYVISGHNLVVDGGFTITNPSFTIFEQS